MRLRQNYRLDDLNTMGVRCSARHFFEYDNVADLRELLADKALFGKFCHMGQGSNLLFLHDYDGLALHSKILGIETLRDDSDHIYIRVGSGVVFDDLVKYCVENKFYGLQNLSFIPGEVGAAPVQNLGAYGVEAGEYIHAVEATEVASGTERTILAQECRFSYRNSIFKTEWKNKYIIHHVTFRLDKKPFYKLDYGNLRQYFDDEKAITIDHLRDVIIDIRRKKLPLVTELGSCGSYFKNPIVGQESAQKLLNRHQQMPHFDVEGRVKIPAAWLIEQSGLKGIREGNVGTYPSQPLILVNYGEKDGAKIAQFAKKISDTVYGKFGIRLEPEVEYID